jgi:hypothetical protein
MGGSTGQQTGWIHLVDLTIAFAFPVPVLKAMRESDQGAAHKALQAPA